VIAEGPPTSSATYITRACTGAARSGEVEQGHQPDDGIGGASLEGGTGCAGSTTGSLRSTARRSPIAGGTRLQARIPIDRAARRRWLAPRVVSRLLSRSLLLAYCGKVVRPRRTTWSRGDQAVQARRRRPAPGLQHHSTRIAVVTYGQASDLIWWSSSAASRTCAARERRRLYRPSPDINVMRRMVEDAVSDHPTGWSSLPDANALDRRSAPPRPRASRSHQLGQ
jgi:hypothetical protein